MLQKLLLEDEEGRSVAIMMVVPEGQDCLCMQAQQWCLLCLTMSGHLQYAHA